MNLREFLVKRHYSQSISDNKCRCCFHDDRSPSAYVNDNSIYCFSCQRLYTLSDIGRKFKVRLDYVQKPRLDINSSTVEDRVMFRHNFEVD